MDDAETDSFLSKFKAEVYRREELPCFLKSSRIAEMHVGVGKLVQALDFFESAVKEYQNPEVDKTIYKRAYLTTLGQYASVLDETGDFVNAETMYKTVLEEDADNFVIGDYAYFLHRRKRDYDEAERHFIKALTLYPHHASIHLKYAGFLRHVRKDMARATSHYHEATVVNPTYADALGSYASFLHGTGGSGDGQDKKTTESLYERAIAADKTHVNNFCNYGLYLSEELGNFEKAEEMYKSAIAITGTHANTLYNYAVLLDSHLKRKDEAEVLYRRCLETQPRHAFALYNLAVLREEVTGNIIHNSALSKHAIGVLEANGENDEDCDKKKAEQASHVISDAKERELLTEVGQLYERAVEADANDFTALADCGRFLCDKLKNFDRGEQFLVASLKIFPQGETALLYMGVLENVHKKNFEKSQQYFDKVLEVNPTHISCLHQKARMLVGKHKAKTKDKDKGKGVEHDILEVAFKVYEDIIQLAAEPGPYAAEYLSQVVTLGSMKQKLNSVVFVESSKNLQRQGQCQGGDVQKLVSMLKNV